MRAVVRDYRLRFRPNARAELESFSREPTLAAAIGRAALAESPNRRRYRHQWRIKRLSLKRGAEVLSARVSEIQETADFATLHDLLEETVGPIKGLGPVYLYDTAFRIGAKRGFFPKRVYLHAGTLVGAKALRQRTRGRAALEVSEVPEAFRQLEPHEIEDVLCIYKRYFTGERLVLDEDTRCWIDSGKDEE